MSNGNSCTYPGTGSENSYLERGSVMFPESLNCNLANTDHRTIINAVMVDVADCFQVSAFESHTESVCVMMTLQLQSNTDSSARTEYCSFLHSTFDPCHTVSSGRRSNQRSD